MSPSGGETTVVALHAVQAHGVVEHAKRIDAGKHLAARVLAMHGLHQLRGGCRAARKTGHARAVRAAIAWVWG